MGASQQSLMGRASHLCLESEDDWNAKYQKLLIKKVVEHEFALEKGKLHLTNHFFFFISRMSKPFIDFIIN